MSALASASRLAEVVGSDVSSRVLARSARSGVLLDGPRAETIVASQVSSRCQPSNPRGGRAVAPRVPRRRRKGSAPGSPVAPGSRAPPVRPPLAARRGTRQGRSAASVRGSPLARRARIEPAEHELHDLPSDLRRQQSLGRGMEGPDVCPRECRSAALDVDGANGSWTWQMSSERIVRIPSSARHRRAAPALAGSIPADPAAHRQRPGPAAAPPAPVAPPRDRRAPPSAPGASPAQRHASVTAPRSPPDARAARARRWRAVTYVVTACAFATPWVGRHMGDRKSLDGTGAG